MYDADSHRGAQTAIARSQASGAPRSTVGSKDQSSDTLPGLNHHSAVTLCLGCTLILDLEGDKSPSSKVTLVSAPWTEKVGQ